MRNNICSVFRRLVQRSLRSDSRVGACLLILATVALCWPAEVVYADSINVFLAWSSPELDTSRSLDWGDWDGDGDLDLAVGNQDEPNRVYARINGYLALVWESPDTDRTLSVAWHDWDNDGDLDLAAGNYGQPNRVYVNEGGTLVSAWLSAEGDNTTSIAWADVDDNGFADLAVGNDGEPNRLYANPGGGLNLIWSSAERDATYSVAWGRGNDDDWLDLAVGNRNGPNRVYRNTGGALALAWTSIEGDDTRSIAWGDVDDDGLDDLAVGNWRDTTPNRLYVNGGDGFSLAWSSTKMDDTYAVRWGDVDGDTDLDLAIGNWSSPNRIYRNEGGALALVWSSQDSDHTAALAWGDWDNDGDLDLAAANANDPNRVYVNGGTHLALAWSSAETDFTDGIALGDYDNDGDLDLAVANGGNPNYVHMFEHGTWTVVWTSPESDDSRSVAWGDWDDDGDLDLAVGNWSGPNRVYANQRGSFVLAWSSSEAENTQSVAWGDWDQDGDLDLAVGNKDSPNRVYTNIGSNLVPAWASSEADATEAIAWGDFDGDEDLDLAVANDEDPNRVYVNADGTLELDWSTPDAKGAKDVAWVDWDQDGDLDLAFAYRFDPVEIYASTQGELALVWTTPEPLNARKIAWGDWNRDGDLDLAVAINGGQNVVYDNHAGTLTPAWRAHEEDSTFDLVWGDVDSDGDLDLVTAFYFGANRLYLNKGLAPLSLAWSSVVQDDTYSVAWGDWDRDGDLDLASANSLAVNRLYTNDGSTLTPLWSSPEQDDTRSLAWGDWDDDGDLDLAVGNSGGPNRVYANEGGTLNLAWSSAESDNTLSVAWGDWDNDNDLDLAVGNNSQPNRIYANHGGTLSLAWSSAEQDGTRSVAWGDWDGDGDLDLAVGNWIESEPNRVYRNRWGDLELAWTADVSERTRIVAWEDWDGDGDLDLTVGNRGQSNRVYANVGGLLELVWSSPETSDTESLAWGDWNGDGTPDLVVGNLRYDQLYMNRGGALELVWTSPELDRTGSVAWGDWDLDGDPDLAVGTDTSNFVFNNPAQDNPALPDSAAEVTILDVAGFAPVAGANLIHNGPILPINYLLKDREGHDVRKVEGQFSVDGGSTWQRAVPTSGTQTNALPATLDGTPHTFYWDVYASGVFGLSNRTVFRLNAYQGYGGAGPYQVTYDSAYSLPFRLRGSQIRVVDDIGPRPDAQLYQRMMDQPDPLRLLTDQTGAPLVTTPDGYVSGQGAVALGDELVALAPVGTHDGYTLYHTSAAPSSSGVNAFTVAALGTQTLTVSAENPLIVFDIAVVLEWDASNDAEFIARLTQDVRLSSAALYDWTNGQAALGRVDIYHAKENWDNADVRILSSNIVRPSANRGGVVATPTTLDHPDFDNPITAMDGYVRMGPTWNRYGDTGTIGNDWANVFAHELGHYLFWLEDTYLGLDEATGLLIPVETCAGTAMSDPYEEVSSEFRFRDVDWELECGATLAELPDWEMIELVYPDLFAPPPTNDGPVTLPLAVTQVKVHPPSSSSALLDDSRVDLGEAIAVLAGGRAYLLHDGVRIADLGAPRGSGIYARGAADGDELCIFGSTEFMCAVLSNGGPLEIVLRPLWQPELIITPVTTTTVKILVDAGGSGPISAKFYADAIGSASYTLTDGVEQTIDLGQPVVDMLVEITGADANERLISGYTAGSGPGRARSFDGPGRARSFDGPVSSGDGRVVLLPPTNIADDVVLVLQVASSLPQPPAGTTQVGRAYYVRPNTSTPEFENGSIAFQYIGLDVLQLGLTDERDKLSVHYWNGESWLRLATIVNTTQNIAAAPLPGPGLYALMASYEILLYGPGQNLVAFPGSRPQPVEEALASIAGNYTSVHSYDASVDEWQIFFVDVPEPFGPMVNSLQDLRPGRGYWINATEDTPWLVRPAATTEGDDLKPNPPLPTTYFGWVRAAPNFVPNDGMIVQASIDGIVCGHGTTFIAGGQIGYVLSLLSHEESTMCAGETGTVAFTVDGHMTTTAMPLSAGKLLYTDLWLDGVRQRLYLPLITTEWKREVLAK